MPKQKRSETPAADVNERATPKNQADRLYRAASECIRQRQRYAQLVEVQAQEEEQQGALRICSICDEVLVQSIKSYEEVAGTTKSDRDEEWWHKANSLWHASREYDRRHRDCDENSRRFGSHSAKQLGELAMQYDLEASALLALQHALMAYRKAAPDAEIHGSGSARVA